MLKMDLLNTLGLVITIIGGVIGIIVSLKRKKIKIVIFSLILIFTLIIFFANGINNGSV